MSNHNIHFAWIDCDIKIGPHTDTVTVHQPRLFQRCLLQQQWIIAQRFLNIWRKQWQNVTIQAHPPFIRVCYANCTYHWYIVKFFVAVTAKWKATQIVIKLIKFITRWAKTVRAPRHCHSRGLAVVNEIIRGMAPLLYKRARTVSYPI